MRRYYLTLYGKEFGPFASLADMLDALLILLRKREAAERPFPQGASWRIEETEENGEAEGECSAS